MKKVDKATLDEHRKHKTTFYYNRLIVLMIFFRINILKT